jgi:hypothetical protein
MLVKIVKTWNTGEKIEQEIEVPENKNVGRYIENATLNGIKGIWTEPDGQ